MDVLVRFAGPMQFVLRIAEQVLLILLAGLCSQSYFYAG